MWEDLLWIGLGAWYVYGGGGLVEITGWILNLLWFSGGKRGLLVEETSRDAGKVDGLLVVMKENFTWQYCVISCSLDHVHGILTSQSHRLILVECAAQRWMGSGGLVTSSCDLLV